jgi:hypothetical protein
VGGTDHPGRLQIDDKLEFGGLLDWQLRRLGAFENPVAIGGGRPVDLAVVRSIGHQATGIDEFPVSCHRYQVSFRRKLDKLLKIDDEERIEQDEKSPDLLPVDSGESRVELIDSPRSQKLKLDAKLCGGSFSLFHLKCLECCIGGIP